MDEWLTIADGSGRNTPYLWVGPNAAGHLKPPGLIMSEGNNALWHYNVEVGKEAAKRGVENLSMYNMTLQAGSWDGSHYGEGVHLVQAMMVSFAVLCCVAGVLILISGRSSIGSRGWRRLDGVI